MATTSVPSALAMLAGTVGTAAPNGGNNPQGVNHPFTKALLAALSAVSQPQNQTAGVQSTNGNLCEVNTHCQVFKSTPFNITTHSNANFNLSTSKMVESIHTVARHVQLAPEFFQLPKHKLTALRRRCNLLKCVPYVSKIFIKHASGLKRGLRFVVSNRVTMMAQRRTHSAARPVRRNRRGGHRIQGNRHPSPQVTIHDIFYLI